MVSINPFTLGKLPVVEFGAGKFKTLSEVIAARGRRVLLVVSRSFKTTEFYGELVKEISKNLYYTELIVSGEPSPSLVDNAVALAKSENIDVVAGIGGGSVLDAGKAISAMFYEEGSVVEYLEVVGTKKPSGRKIPFIAVPTSSGTGSEATKNAVISMIGENGFKRSLRHNNFTPDIAVVDPLLTISLPSTVTAACGLDALTQLLESYTSKNASPITDALSESGIRYIREGFLSSFTNGQDIEARSSMSYAAMLSGITLANAGLGIVHGLAAPIGGFFDIPHGVVCGTLLGSATRMNIDILLNEASKNKLYLEKYAAAGVILSGTDKGSVEGNCHQLVDILEDMIERTKIPILGDYGIREIDLRNIVEKAVYKTNPADLTKEQAAEIMKSRI
jgi:alcohol dehydrogenase class IV